MTPQCNSKRALIAQNGRQMLLFSGFPLNGYPRRRPRDTIVVLAWERLELATNVLNGCDA